MMPMTMKESTYNTGIFRQFDANVLIANHNICDPQWGEENCKYDYHKFYYFQQGEGLLQVNSDIYYPGPNDLFLIPAGVRHTYSHNPLNPVIKYWCHFSIAPSAPWHIQYTPDTFSCQGTPEIFVPLFQEMVAANCSADPLRILELKSVLTRIFKEYLARVNYRQLIPIAEDSFHSVITSYIQTHLAEKITLDQLSAITHTQKNYLISKFKKELGLTPINYINLIRLESCIREMHLHPATDLNQICQKYGFDDYKYFSRLFKQKYGICPSGYKKGFFNQ